MLRALPKNLRTTTAKTAICCCPTALPPPSPRHPHNLSSWLHPHLLFLATPLLLLASTRHGPLGPSCCALTLPKELASLFIAITHIYKIIFVNFSHPLRARTLSPFSHCPGLALMYNKIGQSWRRTSQILAAYKDDDLMTIMRLPVCTACWGRARGKR